MFPYEKVLGTHPIYDAIEESEHSNRKSQAYKDMAEYMHSHEVANVLRAEHIDIQDQMIQNEKIYISEQPIIQGLLDSYKQDQRKDGSVDNISSISIYDVLYKCGIEKYMLEDIHNRAKKNGLLGKKNITRKEIDTYILNQEFYE